MVDPIRSGKHAAYDQYIADGDLPVTVTGPVSREQMARGPDKQQTRGYSTSPAVDTCKTKVARATELEALRARILSRLWHGDCKIRARHVLCGETERVGG